MEPDIIQHELIHETLGVAEHQIIALIQKYAPVGGGGGGGGLVNETDPVWLAEKGGYYTKVESDGKYLGLHAKADDSAHADSADFAVSSTNSLESDSCLDVNLAYKQVDNNFSIVQTAPRFVSNVAIGTSPYSCTSTTINTNLNADMVDGKHIGTSGNVISLLDGNNTWSGTNYISTVSATAFKVGSTPDLLIDTSAHTVTCGTATAAQDTFFTIQTTKLIASWGGTVSADWTSSITTAFNLNPSFSGKPTTDGMMIVGLGGKAYWTGSITDNGKDGVIVGGTNYEGGIVGFMASLTQGKTHLVYGAKFTTYAHDYLSMGNWKSNLNYIAGIFDASGDDPTSPGVAKRLGIYSYDSIAITTAQKIYLSSTLNSAVLTLGGDYLVVPTINTEIDFYVNSVKQAVIDSSGVFNAIGGYKVNGVSGIDATISFYDVDNVTVHTVTFTKGILTAHTTA